jgi:xylulokinase
MGACLSAGLSLSWFARTFCAKTEGMYEALSQEAETAPPGSEGLLFAPYLNGDRTPHRDAAARGAFIGVTPRHTRTHFIRAIMEGVVFSLCETMDIFRELGLPITRVICSGGGSRSALWRQIQADVFETPVEWRSGEEHSAIGAAVVAGAAAGREIPLIAAGNARVTMPKDSAVEAYRALRPVFQQVYPRNAPVFRDLSSIAARAARR